MINTTAAQDVKGLTSLGAHEPNEKSALPFQEAHPRSFLEKQT